MGGIRFAGGEHARRAAAAHLGRDAKQGGPGHLLIFRHAQKRLLIRRMHRLRAIGRRHAERL